MIDDKKHFIEFKGTAPSMIFIMEVHSPTYDDDGVPNVSTKLVAYAKLSDLSEDLAQAVREDLRSSS